MALNIFQYIHKIADPVGVVVESGVDGGNTAHSLFKEFPSADFHVFEANESSAKLYSLMAQDQRVTLYKEALSNTCEEKAFYVPVRSENAGSQLFGSLLEPLDHFRENYKQEKVQTRKFDSWYSNQTIGAIDLLIFRPHGDAHFALEGMQESLKNIRYIYILNSKEQFKDESDLNKLLFLLPRYEIVAQNGEETLLCNVGHNANTAFVDNPTRTKWMPTTSSVIHLYENLMELSNRSEELSQQVGAIKPGTVSVGQAADGGVCFLKSYSNGQWYPFTDYIQPLELAKGALNRIEKALSGNSLPIVLIGFNPGYLVDIIFQHLKENDWAKEERHFYIIVDDLNSFYGWIKQDDRREILAHDQVTFHWHENVDEICNAWLSDSKEFNPISTKPYSHTINFVSKLKDKLSVQNNSDVDIKSEPSQHIDTVIKKYSHHSFSQTGEDSLIRYILSNRISRPTYLDIGAHHPWFINNTATFYLEGARGLNIEPDPDLFAEIEKERPGDTNLNIGIGLKDGLTEFYMMSPAYLNTFSSEEALNYQKNHGHKIRQVREIQVHTLGSIIKKYCQGKYPDILSIDVEGWDLQIVNSIDFNNSPPTIICVETISYSRSGNGIKNQEIIDIITSNGYIQYADTYINSIFVLESFWRR